MALRPNRTDEPDNIVSLRDARARQAEIRAEANKAASGKPAREKKMPALLIFLAMLAILVAYKFTAT